MLGKKHKIGRELFAEVMKTGGRLSTPLFLVRYKKNLGDQKFFRCSVVVSKKVTSKAVDRNNFKRRAYYVVGEAIKNTPTPLDLCTVIFFVKCNLKKVSLSDLKADVSKVFGTIAR